MSALFASMFLQIGLVHLLINLVMIWYLRELEFQPLRFILVYLICGLIGNLFAITFEYVAVLGASGAIIGALSHTVLVSWRNGDSFVSREILLIIGLTIIPGFFLPGVSNGAHIGGMIAGGILALILPS